MLTTFIICGIAALAGGFIDAIAGGGGLLTVPALLLCGIPPHITLGTNKISACLGTTVALINFSLNRLVLWKLVFYGLPFSFIGSWAGTLLALHLDASILGKIVIMMIPFAMVATLVPPKKSRPDKLEVDGVTYWVLLPIVCLCIGLYDGFFGPGTGSFLILGLHWVIGLGLVHASGTAKAFNLGSNFCSAVSFIWHGSVNWPLGLLMAACLMLGNWVGSTFAIKIGAKAVRRFLLVALMLLLVSLIIQYFIK